MIHEINRSNILERVRSAEAPQLIALYERARPHSGGAAQYGQFNLSTLDAFRDHLMVLERTLDGDYIYIHYGAAVASAAGFDMTGRRTSALGGDLAAFFRDCYDEALDEGRLLHTFHQAVKSSQVAVWERVIFPTETADGDRLLVVLNKPVEYRADLLTTVMDASPAGITACRAIRDEAGRMVDAAVVANNPAACAMLGLQADEVIGRRMTAISPTLKERGLWDIYCRVVESGASETFETQLLGEGVWVRTTVAPWQDGFVLVFSDISDLKRALGRSEALAEALSLEIGVERAASAALSSELSEKEAAVGRLTEAADQDSLTGLANRRGFAQRFVDLERTCAPPFRLAVAIIDIDHFKQVNDAYGHAAGDDVLTVFGGRLANGVHPSEGFAARLGGEEFAVCCRIGPGEDAAERLARLKEGICATPFQIRGGRSIDVTGSLGYVLMEPGEPIAEALHRADLALYDAKRAGRNCVRTRLAA